MTILHQTLAVGIPVFASALLAFAQTPGSSENADTYEDRNQIDYGPLKLSVVKGVAIDPTGAPTQHALVLLFTNKTHKLKSKTEADEDGRFKLSKIADGHYRLVVKSPGFCTANVPLLVKARSGSKGLVLHMKPGGIDSCSYGAIK
jgi:hypothetical protein